MNVQLTVIVTLLITLSVALAGNGDLDVQGHRGCRGLMPENTLPGAEPYATELRSRLDEAWGSRAEGYEPRTHHLNGDGTPIYTNRLFLEASPYLRQHKDNPVDCMFHDSLQP